MPSPPPSLPAGPVLVLEAATAAGSVALIGRDAEGRPRRLLAERTVAMGGGRADALTPAVTALLADTGIALDALSAIACGGGPGSFTSLRIAGALAKGLAVGLGCPLYAIPSLLLAVPAADGRTDAALEHGTPAVGPVAGRYLVTADALRGERFAQRVRVDAAGRLHAEGPAVRGAGEHVAMVDPTVTAVPIDATRGVHPRASAARWLGDWSAYGPVDVDAWEPDYGRLAEAQVQWEAAHGRPLPAT